MRDTRPALRLVFIATIALLGIAGVASAAWISNGTPLCLAPETQVDPRVVADGAGGAIVVWEDRRSGDGDIYAQRVDASGNALWMPDGVPLCTAGNSQRGVDAISDGAGGAIVLWKDSRGGSYDTTAVYIQRVDDTGNSLWGVGGVLVCTARPFLDYPRLVSDGAGGAIVTWRDRRALNLDVYAQHVDAKTGNTGWTPDGVLLCSNATTQNFPVPASDGAGGAIIVFEDYRHGHGAVYAQRVDVSGALLWGESGMGLGTLGGRRPDVVSDDAGGAIAAWTDARIFGNFDVYAQRVDAAGNVLWTTDGAPVCLMTGEQADVQLSPDGAGGAVLAWEDYRVGPPDIYAQRVNAAGSVLWTANGVGVCTATDAQYDPRLVGDGGGGAVVVWYDRRAGLNNYDIYAQQVTGLGVPSCLTNGVAVCAGSGGQLLPHIAAGAQGAIVAWHDLRVNTDVNIYAAEVQLCDNPVPVLFTRFTATAKDGAVVLEWATSHDEAFQGFRVYRSASGGAFESVRFDLLPVDATSYRDARVTLGGTYRYMIAAVDGGGSELVSPAVTVHVALAPLALHGNRPNPFNPATTISFTLPGSMSAQIEIFDVAGRLVRTLLTTGAHAGYHELEWDGKDAAGVPVSSGTYLYRLRAGNHVLTRKMTLVQ